MSGVSLGKAKNRWSNEYCNQIHPKSHHLTSKKNIDITMPCLLVKVFHMLDQETRPLHKTYDIKLINDMSGVG
jgi:hypothetical protein